MNKVQQFLMAGTVLSGVAWLQATEARVENDTGGKLALVSRPAGMTLAQAQEPRIKTRQAPGKVAGRHSWEASTSRPSTTNSAKNAGCASRCVTCRTGTAAASAGSAGYAA